MIPGLTIGEYAGLPLTARIFCAASQFLGWRYSLKTPRVPIASGSVPTSLVDPSAMVTNCSTLTSSILMSIYTRDWTPQDYADLQVFGESLKKFPFGDSPIVAATRQLLGQVVLDWDVNQWHLAQTWNRKNAGGSADPTGGGHAMLVYFDGEVYWTLEASGNSKGGVGVRFTAKPKKYFTEKAIVHILRLWP